MLFHCRHCHSCCQRGSHELQAQSQPAARRSACHGCSLLGRHGCLSGSHEVVLGSECSDGRPATQRLCEEAGGVIGRSMLVDWTGRNGQASR